GDDLADGLVQALDAVRGHGGLGRIGSGRSSVRREGVDGGPDPPRPRAAGRGDRAARGRGMAVGIGGSEGPADDLDAVRLDDVVDLDVIEPGDLDAALEVLADLADVVLEAAEGLDGTLVDLAPLADDPRLGVPLDDALGDEA